MVKRSSSSGDVVGSTLDPESHRKQNSSGDQYAGLDQFGRVVNQQWVNGTGSISDLFIYAYDSNGNVTAKDNLLDLAYSQTFTYDQLNRLTGSTLGGAANQSWNLDAQGNWSSFTSNGTTQTETANAQNQITSISGGTTPTYDANGNLISGSLPGQPAGSEATLFYDAWNRLVKVTNSSGTVIAQYSYDARNYRVTETYPQGGTGIPAGTTNYIYYDAQWQAIETRTNGTAASNVTSQMVWSAAYVNAAVLQDTYSGGTLQADSRIYFQQDANWDTTAIVGYNSTTGTWNVVQRYTYSPYGTITVLNADWSTPPTGTNPIVDNLYQGMALDPVTGLYYSRNRNYSPSLGVWISQDPAGYINGADTYQFVLSNPVGNADPEGLWNWSDVLPWNWNWSWLPWVGKALPKAAQYMVPGSEFCAGAQALGNLPKAGGLANLRMQYDLLHGIDYTKDPLYTGLMKVSTGQTLTPAEKQALLNTQK